MDEVLLSYLQATNEAEKQQYLDELLVVHASPVVRHTLRERLAFHVNLSQASSSSQDAEDLYQEILIKIVAFLRELDQNSEPDNIQKFRRYVATLATNACHDYLRRKSPARARLKNNLRDLLNRHPNFAVWKSGDEWFAGFPVWTTNRDSVAPINVDRQLEARLNTLRSTIFPGQNLKQLPLSRVVAALLQLVAAPIELDTLVNLLAKLLGVKDHPPESLDDEARAYLEARLANTTLSNDSRLDARDTLAALWEAVKRLPPRQRDTFCFSFTDQSGDDLFSLLVTSEIVALPQIADDLGRTTDHLYRLWTDMPMSRAVIAAELNATPQQISKWRFRAVKRLEREMFPDAEK